MTAQYWRQKVQKHLAQGARALWIPKGDIQEIELLPVLPNGWEIESEETERHYTLRPRVDRENMAKLHVMLTTDVVLMFLRIPRGVAGRMHERETITDSFGSEEIGYTDEQWRELLEDIKTNGIIQPILINRSVSPPILEDGCHRLSAAVNLKLSRVPVEFLYY